MGFEAKAANNKAPFGDGVASTSTRLFTCDSTSRANAIPDAWAGTFLRVANGANAAQYFFSKNSGASCDETIAAADAGAASPSLGELIPANTVVKVRVPGPLQPGETMYLVRASVSTTTLSLTPASE